MAQLLKKGDKDFRELMTSMIVQSIQSETQEDHQKPIVGNQTKSNKVFCKTYGNA